MVFILYLSLREPHCCNNYFVGEQTVDFKQSLGKQESRHGCLMIDKAIVGVSRMIVEQRERIVGALILNSSASKGAVVRGRRSINPHPLLFERTEWRFGQNRIGDCVSAVAPLEPLTQETVDLTILNSICSTVFVKLSIDSDQFNATENTCV